ncbi:MAG: hypothetical protein ACK2UU_15035, partial [Anaerolineae bacterium]
RRYGTGNQRLCPVCPIDRAEAGILVEEEALAVDVLVQPIRCVEPDIDQVLALTLSRQIFSD